MTRRPSASRRRCSRPTSVLPSTDRVLAAPAQAPRPRRRRDLRDALAEEIAAVLAGARRLRARAAAGRERRGWCWSSGSTAWARRRSSASSRRASRATGARVLLVAADTFRAAAAEQLGVWAERAGVELVRAEGRRRPGRGRARRRLRRAVARGIDVVLVDTAGRLHTKHEPDGRAGEDRARHAAAAVPGAPHTTLLVLDATLGQNGLAQAREFGGRHGIDALLRSTSSTEPRKRRRGAGASPTSSALPVSARGRGRGARRLVSRSIPRRSPAGCCPRSRPG